MAAMKNFIAELLIKLEEKEQESKSLSSQVKAQSLLLSALVHSLNDEQRKSIVTHVNHQVISLSAQSVDPLAAQHQLNLCLSEILKTELKD